MWYPLKISIHAPRAGRDRKISSSLTRFSAFQSTRPVRGATHHRVLLRHAVAISIHAPRAGRDTKQETVEGDVKISIHAPRAGRDMARPISEIELTEISIHAPRAGRDPVCRRNWPISRNFNPRAPCGARPAQPGKKRADRHISIHAPRAGRDPCPCRWWRSEPYFNPRAPCGARPNVHRYCTTAGGKFQSTRPVRGATCIKAYFQGGAAISIHAPRAGRDYPGPVKRLVIRISIHAPRAGRDTIQATSRSTATYFNPRAPCGARHGTAQEHGVELFNFNPRAPCGARR